MILLGGQVSDFSWSSDQEEFRQSVRRFMASHSDEAAVRRAMASPLGYDRDVWAAMASQLGVQGLAIPEAYGGAGFTFAEAAIVHEEAGRMLLCGPLLASASLATPALLRLGGEAAERYLPGIASGACVATLAVQEMDRTWSAQTTTTTARPAGSGQFALTGVKAFVLDGAHADLLLVAAHLDGELGLFAVDGNAEGLNRTPQQTLDPTRRLARIELQDCPGALLGVGSEAEAAIASAMTIGAIALAAEQVGGSERALELSVEQAKLREQFGRPIGAFQAIRHRLADLYLAVETARSVATHAALVAARGGDVTALAQLARSACSRAFRDISEAMIQVHGATGFTWEHVSHLYYKRARADAELLGSPEQHRMALATAAGL
jgi:alkylation response protein AidB-like acyl-CoA dehydrogenase